MARILYVTYDGLLEPLGQSQVLAYLKGLSKKHHIHIISYEKKSDWQNIQKRRSVAQQMEIFGIVWHPLPYHKRLSLLATAYDIGCGAALGIYLCLRHRLRIIHARSYVPSVLALILKPLFNLHYVFDMRGFWVDERVDGGLWPRNGLLYRLGKWFETRFLRRADAIVSLTCQAADIVADNAVVKSNKTPIYVIPTCADLQAFRPIRREPYHVTKPSLVLGYVGSTGTWYLFDEVVACFARLQKMRPDAVLRIFNRHEHDFIRQALARYSISESAYSLQAIDYSDMPQAMATVNAGIFFIKPVFSKLASSPTRLAEFLGCGKPCLTNTGVGNVDTVIVEDNTGALVSEFNDAAYDSALVNLLELINDPDCESRCVNTAHRHFSLDAGIARYHEIYRRLC